MMVKRFEVYVDRCSKFTGYVNSYSNGRIQGIEFRKSTCNGCLLYRCVQVNLYLERNQNIRISFHELVSNF